MAQDKDAAQMVKTTGYASDKMLVPIGELRKHLAFEIARCARPM